MLEGSENCLLGTPLIERGNTIIEGGVGTVPTHPTSFGGETKWFHSPRRIRFPRWGLSQKEKKKGQL